MARAPLSLAPIWPDRRIPFSWCLRERVNLNSGETLKAREKRTNGTQVLGKLAVKYLYRHPLDAASPIRN